jgi:hypothetical protein
MQGLRGEREERPARVRGREKVGGREEKKGGYKICLFAKQPHVKYIRTYACYTSSGPDLHAQSRRTDSNLFGYIIQIRHHVQNKNYFCHHKHKKESQPVAV